MTVLQQRILGQYTQWKSTCKVNLNSLNSSPEHATQHQYYRSEAHTTKWNNRQVFCPFDLMIKAESSF